MSVLPARTRSACGLCSYLLSGGGAEVAGAQSEWHEGLELAGQVGQSLIFSNVSNNDRRLRNPKSMLVPSPSPRWRLPVTESFALPPDPGWNAMTDYPAAIPLLAIQQLRCPKCRTRMRLARISPGPRGFELRTFECAKCDHVEQIAIASDPMKSGAVGWFTGELQPPK
jgi:hypothetical protein